MHSFLFHRLLLEKTVIKLTVIQCVYVKIAVPILLKKTPKPLHIRLKISIWVKMQDLEKNRIIPIWEIVFVQ
jgi:hypothetical protein